MVISIGIYCTDPPVNDESTLQILVDITDRYRNNFYALRNLTFSQAILSTRRTSSHRDIVFNIQ